jgi:hypothetical protein
MLILLSILACGADVEPPPSVGPDPQATPTVPAFQEALGMGSMTRTDLHPILGESLDYEHYTVRPLSLEIFPDFRISGALFEPKSEAPQAAFLMAHGHFGEGKSAGESQAPAHALATRGYTVLALDTPGVEEGDRPDRQIHFDEGQVNRQRLEQAGTSAMALQLHGLQAGLDYLENKKESPWIAVGGASGGAVQAFYLSLIDARPKALVMASFVPMPRVKKEGGCPCDWVPGGWSQDWIASLKIPSLWMSEGAESRPESLGSLGQFSTHAGPHGFERPMIEESIRWLDELHRFENKRALPLQLPHTPSTSLASQTIGTAGIKSLLQDLSPSKED